MQFRSPKTWMRTKGQWILPWGPLWPLHFWISVSAVPIISKIKAKPFTTASTGLHKLWPWPASPHSPPATWASCSSDTPRAVASSSALAVASLCNHLHPIRPSYGSQAYSSTVLRFIFHKKTFLLCKSHYHTPLLSLYHDLFSFHSCIDFLELP